MADAKDRDYTNFITQERDTIRELFNSARRDIERYINQTAIREAIENHKSNWIPNSKGGEPNCRRG